MKSIDPFNYFLEREPPESWDIINPSFTIQFTAALIGKGTVIVGVVTVTAMSIYLLKKKYFGDDYIRNLVWDYTIDPPPKGGGKSAVFVSGHSRSSCGV
jgi:hypothetical protein